MCATSGCQSRHTEFESYLMLQSKIEAEKLLCLFLPRWGKVSIAKQHYTFPLGRLSTDPILSPVTCSVYLLVLVSPSCRFRQAPNLSVEGQSQWRLTRCRSFACSREPNLNPLRSALRPRSRDVGTPNSRGYLYVHSWPSHTSL